MALFWTDLAYFETIGLLLLKKYTIILAKNRLSFGLGHRVALRG